MSRGSRAALLCGTKGKLAVRLPPVALAQAKQGSLLGYVHGLESIEVAGSGALQLRHTPSRSCQVWERFRTGSSSLGAAIRRPWGVAQKPVSSAFIWSISRPWLSGPCCFSNLRAVVIGPSIRAQTELGLRGHGLSSSAHAIAFCASQL